MEAWFRDSVSSLWSSEAIQSNNALFGFGRFVRNSSRVHFGLGCFGARDNRAIAYRLGLGGRGGTRSSGSGFHSGERINTNKTCGRTVDPRNANTQVTTPFIGSHLVDSLLRNRLSSDYENRVSPRDDGLHGIR